MAVTSNVCSAASFRRHARPLLGLPVSRIWQSFAWTLFLELGKLTWESYPRELRRRLTGRRGSRRGEAGLMMEAGWRIETEDGILSDFRGSSASMRRALRSLKGRTVEAVGVEGRLPELSVKLSGGLWVRSLTVALEEPSWALFLEEDAASAAWLSARGRHLIREVGF